MRSCPHAPPRRGTGCAGCPRRCAAPPPRSRASGEAQSSGHPLCPGCQALRAPSPPNRASGRGTPAIAEPRRCSATALAQPPPRQVSPGGPSDAATLAPNCLSSGWTAGTRCGSAAFGRTGRGAHGGAPPCPAHPKCAPPPPTTPATPAPEGAAQCRVPARVRAALPARACPPRQSTAPMTSQTEACATAIPFESIAPREGLVLGIRALFYLRSVQSESAHPGRL
mmetsp:Transcript_50163/g.95837  ORF Transcript_50163/g.95837 Transcript_50163/m.95837 type:complete len:225 (-) Transcript_50163:317-991(-)